MTGETVLSIACDESGSEGENLMLSQHAVFVHASVSVAMDAATEFMDMVRSSMRAQSPEVKSKTALASRNRPALLAAMGSSDLTGNINLVEKSYFVVARLLEITVAQKASSEGQDIAGSGGGRELADFFHAKGPSAVGRQVWDGLLRSFNDLVRIYAREGTQSPTAKPFFDALVLARFSCTNRQVGNILDEIWAARYFAAEYEDASPFGLREMDPMAFTLSSVARNWGMRLGDVPFELVTDQYSGLTDELRAQIVEAVRAPLSIGPVALPEPNLRGIRMVDSRGDSRVQIADILGGIGREIVRLAVDGVFDDELQVMVHEMLDYNVMCSTGSAIDVLLDRRPLRYFASWQSAQSL
ncbi:hypothetical protein [Subtercola sp. RTI3]|uniref:hypothetical protein n=1 Tax=Subtercola sp. RTI3 TaxID=3048639 RepID=UPI002B233F4F|nr:hypothetical protein [Subtercola sp. RTI3]MEA9986976.1 hypothetical protein [Subtercola sp. RTI3]